VFEWVGKVDHGRKRRPLPEVREVLTSGHYRTDVEYYACPSF
jgi:hypothetical protein